MKEFKGLLIPTNHSSREYALSSRNNYSLSGYSWESDINSKDLVYQSCFDVMFSANAILVMRMHDLI